MNNLILNTDSYKPSHYLQYPFGTQGVFSYIESRGGEYDETVFFGLQMFIKDYLLKPITKEMIDEATEICKLHGIPFYREGWEYILNEHDGYLPLRIRAVPEGSIIPVKNVLATVENTDPECYWLTSYMETAILRAVWYPTTVATISREIKKTIKTFLDDTAKSSDGLVMQLHDFGARGATSLESSGIGGLAHLVNFYGTDTMEALIYGRKFYHENMPAFSIPAAEHSTMTAWGKKNETLAYKNMINQFGGDGNIFAVVSDSYDIYHAVQNIWGKELKDLVINNGGTLVVRPDSGYPPRIVFDVLNILGEQFGYEVNSKGYKVLPPFVRVIQGDGCDHDMIHKILTFMQNTGWSAENVNFGMGGGLLQHCDRDTQKFAMKCSSVNINGHWSDVFKEPVTDPGKKSKRGRVTLARTSSGSYHSIREEELGVHYGHETEVLETVYEDGSLLRDQTFADIRKLAEV